MKSVAFRGPGQSSALNYVDTSTLVSLRITLDDIRTRKVDRNSTRPDSPEVDIRLLDRLAKYLAIFHNEQFAYQFNYSSWWTTYLHRLIIHFAVLERFIAELDRPEVEVTALECMRYGRDVLFEFADGVVSKTHPKDAEAIRNGLAAKRSAS